MTRGRGFTVYSRGSYYYVEFDVDGKRCKRSTGVHIDEPKEIAEEVAKSIVETLRPQSTQVKSKKIIVIDNSHRMLLSEAIERAHKQRWSKNKDDISPYRRSRIILELLGDLYLDEIKTQHIDELQENLFERGISSSTVNRYMAALKTIFNLAIDRWEVIAKKPFIFMHRESPGRIRYLSYDEETLLLTYVKATGNLAYAQLFAALIDTGCRFSELNNLSFGDVKLNEKFFHIWKNKADRPRTVPMTDRVQGILKHRHDLHPPNGKPFGLSYDYSNTLFNNAKAKMGLSHEKDFTIHALRHTCASRLVQSGENLYNIKEILGHSTISVTERYAHLNVENLRKSISQLEKRKVDVILY